MKNGKCPTWFVVKWLSDHPTHTAKAPETGSRYEALANKTKCFLFENYIDGEWVELSPEVRDDWTIYNERGRKVRFKQKRESLIIGELHPGEDLVVVCSGETRSNIISNCGADTVDLLIRNRRKSTGA